ncbi:MAG: DUF5688 family protein [Eubacteriales bacterium]|nr:DUF5688 family protein [Eubacteriales bacterium]
MNYEDFVCFVKNGMQERLGEEVQVQIHQIMKNNSVILDGLSVSERDSGIAPTIYVNDFYREYCNGMTMPEILDCIENIYHKSQVKLPFDTAFYADFEKVRSNLACRLINRARNEELLKRIPHRPFLNLEMVVYYRFEDNMLGNGTILVYESHRKSWRVTEEELFAAARENTLRLQPEEFLSMDSVLSRYHMEDLAPEKKAQRQPMYVLSNKDGAFGAACILFDSVLKKIGDRLGGNFWVLPSSIHECIIVPESIPMKKEELQAMVREINRNEVDEEEYLSDEIYFYRRDLHRLSM